MPKKTQQTGENRRSKGDIALLEDDAMKAPKRRAIEIRGACEHNLKNVSVNLPHETITVITGPSGSGKSSLAFDTLYAEGQRRFLESLSTYARQFMARFEKPDVESIVNILPAIALEQKNAIKNARSTVGTATEVDDYLRLLYATIGVLVDEHGAPVERVTPERIARELIARFSALPVETRLVLVAPVSMKQLPFEDAIAQGYRRLFIAGEVVDADAENYQQSKTPEIVIDRIIIRPEETQLGVSLDASRYDELADRLLQSIRRVFQLSGGQLKVYPLTGDNTASLNYTQTELDAKLLSPSPHLFSFNSPLGACETCEGYGRVIGLDLGKVIPNPRLTLAEGAVHPFNTPANFSIYEDLMAEAKARNIPTNIAFDALDDASQKFVLKGAGAYPGVYKFFNWLESKKYKVHVRVQLAKYRSYTTCYDCDGSRLRPESLRFWLDQKSIFEMQALPIRELRAFFETYRVDEADWPKVRRIFREIRSRLAYLDDIGLGYLSLSRQSRTLSGGESQRIHLASALGSQLTDTLYVLDEPTVGLHAKDTAQLLGVLQQLRDAGNTVVVVEHDVDMILGADHLVELGPSGGADGGYLVFDGTPDAMLASPLSVTGRAIQERLSVTAKETSAQRAKPKAASGESFRIVGASGHNLKNITVDIPKNQLVCISGVSGSGKSTLIQQTLYANYQQSKGRELTADACPCERLEGLDDFADVLFVDQSPPGRSARSNPATYVKAYDEIRKLMAATREATLYGITASHFSFNTAGGRCERCEGLGYLTIDMQFMADVEVTCPDCNGRRFLPSVLAIEWEGQGGSKSIDAILNLTVQEAATFFASEPRLVKKLQPLLDVGLGYLKLGQSTSRLSGGEAQRLKLSSYLADSQFQSATSEPYLLLFDEPSTGLHLVDIDKLVMVFKQLVSQGHSLVVVEHNLDVLRHAETIIDLGPGAGHDGGAIVAQGRLDEVIEIDRSITGVYLRRQTGKTVVTP